MHAVLVTLFVAASALGPSGVGAQQSSSSQPCAANAVPTPEQTARRRQGVQLARIINTLQVNQPGASAKKYLQQQDLGTSPLAARQTGPSAEFIKNLNFTPGAELSPGWELTLDVTSTGYWFVLRDKTDPCWRGFISNQSGIIFDARPLQ